MPYPDPQVPTPNPLYRGGSSHTIPSLALQRKGFVFDPSQKHQVHAIDSTVALFEGQTKVTGTSYSIAPDTATSEENALFAARAAGVVHNRLDLDREALLNNLIKVQESNYLEHSTELKVENGVPHYDIEMETGTGKTYVYLRTILELAKNYGFTKFVIVVPSVAIREGVKTSINAMRAHFKSMYAQYGVTLRETFYKGDTPEEIYSFATGIGVEILITTVNALNGTKANRIIHQERDTLNGLAPIDYIRATRPVVILDEPQRMEAAKSSAAIAELNPLAVLRYSATHKVIRNLVYRLDPVDAVQQNLVKKIGVDSVLVDGKETTPYIRLISVNRAKDTLKATLELAAQNRQGGIDRKKIALKQGDSLARKANNDAYGDIAVNHISMEYGADNAFVELSAIEGKNLLRLGESLGDENMDQVHHTMIRETIRHHLNKEYQLQGKGVKVLSLFFTDSVHSYLGDGTNNMDADGNFARWFDELYAEEVERLEQMTGISNFCSHDPLTARRAYFSQLKAKRGQTQGEYVDSTGKKEDDDAYELIMQDKERLLSHEEPVRFIFSHSALREGWDNPNIFQICVLRTMNTVTERRQTIGRGLRLPVSVNNGTLTRLTDPDLARLTVIANESYRDFAENLQKEYREAGVSIGRVRRTDFAGIAARQNGEVSPTETLGVTQSGEIFDALVKNKMLTKDGEPTAQFTPNMLGFTLGLPEEYAPYEEEITQVLDSNQDATKLVENVKKRGTRKFNPNFPTELFTELWERIAADTNYWVQLDSSTINDKAVELIREASKDIKPVRIRIEESAIDVRRSGVKAGGMTWNSTSRTEELNHSYPLPDIVEDLQKATDLSRKTIVDILKNSETLDKFIANPGEYMVTVRKILKSVVEDSARYNAVFRPRIVDIESYQEETGATPRYHAELEPDEEQDILWHDVSGGGDYLTEGAVMPLMLASEALAQLQNDRNDYPLDKLYKVLQPEKTDYDYLLLDSQTELQFARKLEDSSAVKFFMKLPSNFKIDTPSGKYNPDWAYVVETGNGDKVFCVVETKSTHNEAERRDEENQKIEIGTKHYDAVNRLILSAKYSDGSSLKILPKVIYGVKTHEDSPIPR